MTKRTDRVAKVGSKRIIWAFDPFSSTPSLHAVSARLLRLIEKFQPREVEAVYVLNPEDLEEVDESAPLHMAMPAVQKALDKAVAQIGQSLKGVGSHILLQRRPSLQRSVRSLADYALATGADLIVCETHARHGLQRFFVGSFTESLLLESQVPVLVVNPGTHPTPIRKILFPTDFDGHARGAFGKVVEFAKEMGAEIHMLYVMPRPVEPLIQEGVYLMGGGWVPLGERTQTHTEHQRELAKEWVDLSRRRGVNAWVSFDSNSFGIRQTILNHARTEGSDLIAMAPGSSGAVSAAVFGSISRQVVREAGCPVLVACA